MLDTAGMAEDKAGSASNGDRSTGRVVAIAPNTAATANSFDTADTELHPNRGHNSRGRMPAREGRGCPKLAHPAM